MVAAGRYANLEEVVSAGVEALQERDQADRAWLAYARREAELGFSALDRNDHADSSTMRWTCRASGPGNGNDAAAGYLSSTITALALPLTSSS